MQSDSAQSGNKPLDSSFLEMSDPSGLLSAGGSNSAEPHVPAFPTFGSEYLDREVAQLLRQTWEKATLEERQRLARELHDSVIQSLYSMTLFATVGQQMAEAGELTNVQSYLSQLGETAQQVLKEMRLLIYDLRPPVLERGGLAGALKQRLNTVEERTGVVTHLLIEGRITLSAPVEAELYRIVQEALNNSAKYAHATKVTVHLRGTAGEVQLEVSDNGQGFDLAVASDRGGLGLVSMRERAEGLGASFAICSAPGQGTQVTVRLGVNTTR